MKNHQFIIYGIRELTDRTLHPTFISNQSFHFAFNYRLRIFQAGCFDLDSNHQWQSDGLMVRDYSYTSIHLRLS
jgi:hypothetical protein